MEEDFKNYLESIGFTPTLLNRVDYILNSIIEFVPETINDIFVDDYIKDSGREYDSIYFFSANLIYEAKNFRTKEDFNVVPLKAHVLFYKVNIEKYNFKDEVFGDESKFLIEFGIEGKVYAELKSARNNCNQLKKILQTYVIPNLKE